MEKPTKKTASLTVLSVHRLNGEDKQFIEVRQWQSFSGEHCELVVEHGEVNDRDVLLTQIEVVPFFLSTEEALESVNGRKGN